MDEAEAEKKSVSAEEAGKEAAIQETAKELITLSQKISPALVKKVEGLLHQIGLMIPAVQTAVAPPELI